MQLHEMNYTLDDELVGLVRRALASQQLDDDPTLQRSHLYRELIELEPYMSILEGTRSLSGVQTWITNRADSETGDEHGGLLALKNLQSKDNATIGLASLWELLLREVVARPATEHQPVLTPQMIRTYQDQRQLETAFFGEQDGGNASVLRLLGSHDDVQEADRLIDELEDGIKKFADLGLPDEVVEWFEGTALRNLARLRSLLSSEASSTIALSGMASEAKELSEGTRNSFGATYGWLKDKGPETAGLATTAYTLANMVKSAIEVIPGI